MQYRCCCSVKKKRKNDMVNMHQEKDLGFKSNSLTYYASFVVIWRQQKILLEVKNHM